MTTPFSRIGARKRAQAAPPGRLPPGQYVPRGWPVLHYGRVPAFDERNWDLKISGATASGEQTVLDWSDVEQLPRRDVVADFHCVTRFSVLGSTWTGVPTADLLLLVPPADRVSHVMVWAEYGYSANLRLADLTAAATMLATHRDGERLTPEHGFPVRLLVPHLYGWKSAKWVREIEYLTEDRRGFWEERGYHNVADPWREQRYSYQEEPGEGPV